MTFIQRENRDADLGYVTHIDYRVIRENDGLYGLERHVYSNEFGKADAAQLDAEIAFAVSNPSEAVERRLAELAAMRLPEAAGLEQEMGLLVVGSIEAQAILEAISAQYTI